MYSDPYNPEQSPEKLKNKERSPEELDGRWDELAAEYAEENPTASPEELAAKMGEVPEFDGEIATYEKVYTKPVFGVDGAGEDFNQITNDFLAKGFWLKKTDSTPVTEMTRDDLEEHFDNITAGQQTEGGQLKYASLSEANVSGDAAVNIFENSKRADFGVEELADVAKGVPELSENIGAILANINEISQMLDGGSSVDELRAKYETCLAATGSIHTALVKANVPVELSGAILSKTKALERNLKTALDDLPKTEKTSAQTENQPAEVFATPENDQKEVFKEEPHVVTEEMQKEFQKVIESQDGLEKIA